MSDETIINLAALVTVVGLTIYAIFGGADFGGGVWDLFASGPRKAQQRDAIAHAMGPVWEANHVWLIFVLVMLFTCFPRAYAQLGIRLFLPFHLAMLGIILRGAAFAFRSYLPKQARLWTALFGGASAISPMLLGAAFGAVTSGTAHRAPWSTPYALVCGILALATCAYLAAVFLCVETRGQLREDFRRRAIISGTSAAALAVIVLVLARRDARWFFDSMLAPGSILIMTAGLSMFAASAISVFTRRFTLARWCAGAQIALLLIGWANAQRPYLVYPDFTLINSAGSIPTIKFLLATVPIGAMLLAPSLWLLFRVFKSRDAGPMQK